MANFNNNNFGYGNQQYPYNMQVPNNNPYLNQLANNLGNNQYQNQQQTQQFHNYAFVTGIEGAKAFMMQPNQMMLLMDNDYDIAYRKVSNNLGQSQIEYFRLSRMTEQEAKNYIDSFNQNILKNTANDKYVLKEDFNNLSNKIDDILKRLDDKKETTVEV